MTPTVKRIILQGSMLPLDQYKNNIAMGFSYYKLLTNYTGYCVRVRRSSDNVEQDFGFVNNYIDIVSILAFCGANSGYVSIWYNQYSLGNNAVQTTTGNQPIIVSSGIFETNGLKFVGTSSQTLVIVPYAAINITEPIQLIFLNYVITSSVGYFISKNINSSDNVQYAVYDFSGLIYRLENTNVVSQAKTNGVNYKTKCIWNSKSANGTQMITGETITNGTLNATLTVRSDLQIGSRCNGAGTYSTFLTGNIKSLIMANADIPYSILSKV